MEVFRLPYPLPLFCLQRRLALTGREQKFDEVMDHKKWSITLARRKETSWDIYLRYNFRGTSRRQVKKLSYELSGPRDVIIKFSL